MPIKGIDKVKCTNCQQCINECPALNFRLDENKQVQFKLFGCIGCGHCISVCPEEAIIYSSMRDEPITFKGIEDPSSLISYDMLQKFLRAKRSIRQYKKEKIPKEILDKVINSMRYAPTGGNFRRLKIQIISDDNQKKALSDAILNDLVKNSMLPEAYEKTLEYKRKKGLDPIFYDAPHVLILHSNNTDDLVNSTIAITYGMLSAQTLGLGTCWIGFANWVLISNEEIRKNMVKIPGKVHGVFVIGYPNIMYSYAAPRPKIRITRLGA